MTADIKPNTQSIEYRLTSARYVYSIAINIKTTPIDNNEERNKKNFFLCKAFISGSFIADTIFKNKSLQVEVINL
ncbi:hypothetical protein [Pedobacter rhizosphaerae]|uniref:Uncharacterized protein n=1 Tax=Pedobacter rhizosphaerae TaxID=390241 RepID=A0A1H9SLG2_9SPHI|nr:hypothetical protein [Pedobacter rhizosphaerae]SER85203.1 hypothetical protein SAMN04488023_11859 [Pedobacter rhizosphaerae]